MQSLPNLIRMSKFQLDEKQRRIAEVRELIEQMQLSYRLLEEEMLQEQNIAKKNQEMRHQFLEYKGIARKRQQALQDSVIQLEQEADAILEEIAACFQELKRYEITYDQRQAEDRRHFKKRETAQMDEMGLNAYRRRQTS